MLTPDFASHSVMCSDTHPNTLPFHPSPSRATIQLVWFAIHEALLMQAGEDDRCCTVDMNLHLAVLVQLKRIVFVADELQEALFRVESLEVELP